MKAHLHFVLTFKWNLVSTWDWTFGFGAYSLSFLRISESFV